MSTRFLPSTSILDHFRKLSSNNAEERVTAATAIVIETSESGAYSGQTVNYVLTRLTKGLASGSDSSRLGFGIAYVEFLKQALGGGSLNSTGVTLQDVLQLLIEHTTAPSGTTGQEDRDFAFGRLFGIKAVLESGAVLSSAANAASYWPSILDLLFELARKKSWLRETCAFTISRTITEADKTDKEFLDLTWEKLSQSGLENTSEGIAIKLALFDAAADLHDKKTVAFANEKFPLDKGYLKTLARLLKESPSFENGSKIAAPQKGNWNAKLPFVWDNIIKLYMSGNLEIITNNIGELASFFDFWKIVVDESLFAANSSEERKFWGFQVFGKVLDAAGEDFEVVTTVFSPNFMKCLINQLSNSERYLHKAAQKAVRTIQTVAESRITLIPYFVEHLLLHHGTTNFDMITKTKTVEKLIPFADEQGLQELVELFRRIIANTGVSDVKQVERRRQWAADQLLSLVRHKKIVKKDSWLEPIVDLFVTFGHFRRSDRSVEQQISATSHGMFRTRLMSCLAALIETKGNEGGKSASHAVKTIGELEKDSNYVLAIEMDSEIKDAKKSAVKKLQRIKKQKKSASRMKKAQLEAFELLYAMVILQVLNGDPDAINVLDELQICFEKISSSSEIKSAGSKHEHRSKRVKLDEVEIDEGDGGADVSQVLTEILLSFVSRQSVLLRRLAKTVFTAFVNAMTEPSLNLMFDVLATKESMEGQNALFDEDASGDEIEEGSDGSDSDEMDSDVEVVEVNGKDDESDDNNDSEEGGDKNEETEGLDDEAAAKLDADLAALLGVPRPDGSAMEVDGDDDEDMNDDEMLKMDEKIAEVFRQRNKVNSKSKKKQRMEAKETVINFKNRVLELLEVYVKHQFTDELSLSVVLPLLALIRQTTSKVVANNAHGVIKALVMASKGKGGGGGNNKDKDEDKETTMKPAELPRVSDPKGLLQDLLKEIHNEAGIGRTKEHAAACSQCSLYIIKVLVHSNDKYLEKAFKLYAESMSRWMRDEKFNAQQTLFSDLVTWAGSVRKQFCSK